MRPSVTRDPWPWQLHQGYPWKGMQYFSNSEEFVTDGGGRIPSWQLAYEEWGPDTASPVVVFHALTGDSHVASHSPEGSDGWWGRVVGPAMGLDTRNHHVLCFNVLGGAMGSMGPSSLDSNGQPWGSRFPALTLFDIARSAHALLSTWAARPIRIIGGSMGGMLAYAYAALYPGEVQAVMAIGAPIRHEPWAIAYHTVGRQAICNDPAFQGGDYYEGPFPESGLAIARMADMISYQHPQSMERKFAREKQSPDLEDFQVTSYLRYQGQKLVSRYDANTYIALTRAMDEFQLEPQHLDRLRAVPLWMVGLTSDLLYLPQEIEAHYEILASHGVPVRLSWLEGPWGHDTFLVDQEKAGAIVAQFLQETST